MAESKLPIIGAKALIHIETITLSQNTAKDIYPTVPSGYRIVDAEASIGTYKLPYMAFPSNGVKTWVHRIYDDHVTLANTDTSWTNYELRLAYWVKKV